MPLDETEMQISLLAFCLFGSLLLVSARTVSKVDPPVTVWGRTIGVNEENDYLFTSPDNEEYVKTSETDDYEGGSCILDVNNDLPKKNEPLLLETSRTSNGFDFVKPEAEGRNGIVALRQGQEIIFACPGNKNFLGPTKEEVSRAVCVAGKTLAVNGQRVNSVDLDCSGRTESTTKITQRRCANGKGVIVELGFESLGWNKLVEVCHNMQEANTYYAVHTINGGQLAGKVYRKTGRPNFARGDSALFRGFQPERAYNQKNQQDVLTRELGAKTTAALTSSKTHFLSRGHLAPDADFLFSPHQLLTYFYVNVAPQWQIINAGNWLRVEENTRRRAISLGADLDVATGTYGVLKLKGEKGVRDIRLQDSRIPVPELFWKVLRNTQDDSCIAFVATNNPFLTEKPRQICNDICDTTGWPSYQNDFPRGYVYCCEYSGLKRAVPEVPDLKCRGVLKGK